MSRRAWLLVPVLLVACSTLPDHARPRAEVGVPSAYRARDAIRYRQITRADFRAAAPPTHVAAHARSFGAFTCTRIAPMRVTRARFEPDREPGTWVGRFENTAFRAEMDRACSWWNPEKVPVPAAYVLQHEQIHFALTEIEARRLSARLREVRLRTDSPAHASAELQRRYDALLEDSRDALLRTATEFDEDTSGSYQPERQARWLARVESELARIREAARR